MRPIAMIVAQAAVAHSDGLVSVLGAGVDTFAVAGDVGVADVGFVAVLRYQADEADYDREIPWSLAVTGANGYTEVLGRGSVVARRPTWGRASCTIVAHARIRLPGEGTYTLIAEVGGVRMDTYDVRVVRAGEPRAPFMGMPPISA